MKSFTKVKRNKWSELSKIKSNIKYQESKQITSVGNVIDIDDVKEVYLPLVRYLYLCAQHKKMISKLKDHIIVY